MVSETTALRYQLGIAGIPGREPTLPGSRESPAGRCPFRATFCRRRLGLSGNSWKRVPIDAQSIDAPLSRSAIFLVVGVAEGEAALAKTCSVLGGLDDLVKTVGFRDLSGRLSCIV